MLTALVDHVRPALRDAGDEELVLTGLADVRRRGTGADWQRATAARSGVDAVAREAAEATLRS